MYNVHMYIHVHIYIDTYIRIYIYTHIPAKGWLYTTQQLPKRYNSVSID